MAASWGSLFRGQEEFDKARRHAAYVDVWVIGESAADAALKGHVYTDKEAALAVLAEVVRFSSSVHLFQAKARIDPRTIEEM